jgi:ubiquinone/menaquinone biosynthesis C-methylase UbiE
MSKQNALKKELAQRLLGNYLDFMPLSLAILRSIEAKYLADVKLTPPILDLGCGTGEFAQGFFHHQQMGVGMDISIPDILQAKKTKKYQKLLCADGRNLPFKNNCFNSVVSISTLEHINRPGRVISEVFRVLAPGGKLAMTVNTIKIGQMLFWPKVLRRLGWVKLAESYINFFHQVFNHQTLWGEKRWRRVLRDNGFRLEKVEEIFSAKVVEHFDRWLPTSLPAQLIRRVTGKRWVWRPDWINKWLVNRYGWLVTQDEQIGGNLFIVTSKPW